MLHIDDKFSQTSIVKDYSEEAKAKLVKLIKANGCIPFRKLFGSRYVAFRELYRKNVISHVVCTKHMIEPYPLSDSLEFREIILIKKAKAKYPRYRDFVLLTEKWLGILNYTLEDEIEVLAWDFVFRRIWLTRFIRKTEKFFIMPKIFKTKNELLNDADFMRFSELFWDIGSYDVFLLNVLNRYDITYDNLSTVKQKIYDKVIKNIFIFQKEKQVKYGAVTYDIEF